MDNLPKEQWGLVNTSQGKIQVQKIPMPTPGEGQVLVKIHAAPVNPSDLAALGGAYDAFGVQKFNYPIVNGNEGSGTVVASGGGDAANAAVGKTVAFGRVGKNSEYHLGGCFQQYMVANAMSLLPINPEELSLDIASMSIVNPMTAILLFQQIAGNGSKAGVQSGASSQLGRMLCYLCKQSNTPLINLVRREEQVKMLKEEHGQEHVLCTKSETFFEDLKKLTAELGAKVFIDSVGGEMTGKTIECLPVGSNTYQYGALSNSANLDLNPIMQKGLKAKIHGFILGAYLAKQGAGAMLTFKQGMDLMKLKEFQPVIQKKFALTATQDCIKEYSKNQTGGKFLLCPNMEDEGLVGETDFKEWTLRD